MKKVLLAILFIIGIGAVFIFGFWIRIQLIKFGLRIFQ